MDNSHRSFVVASFLSFFLISMPFAIHGTNAPLTMAYYGINAAQQGFIITMQSVGGISMAVFLALKGEKYNKINVLALGLIIICLACAAVGLLPAYTVLVILIAAGGVGISCIDVMMNGVIADVYPKIRNTLLPITHAFYGVGSTFLPIFVTLAVNAEAPETFARPYRIISAMALAIFIVYFASSRRIMKDTPYINMEDMKKQASENPAEIFKTGTAWMFFAVGTMYFSFQVGTAMWLPTYTISKLGVDFETGGYMLFAFFAGALLMRFLGPLFLKVLTPRLLFALFGLGALALMLAAIFTTSTQAMFVFICACGFMQGSSVAAFILMCTDAFPTRTASASSLCALSAGTATLTGPLWMGALSDQIGFQIPMLLICGLLAISSLIILVAGKPPAA